MAGELTQRTWMHWLCHTDWTYPSVHRTTPNHYKPITTVAHSNIPHIVCPPLNIIYPRYIYTGFIVHSKCKIQELFKDFWTPFTVLFQHQNYWYEIKLFHRNQSHNVSSTQEIPTKRSNIVKQLIVCYHKVLQECHHWKTEEPYKICTLLTKRQTLLKLQAVFLFQQLGC